MTIAMTETELACVRAILHDALPVGSRAYVFGSRARPAPRRGADLDIAIEAPDRLPLSASLRLRVAFEASPLPYFVDIVDIRAIEGVFARNVARDKVRLL